MSKNVVLMVTTKMSKGSGLFQKPIRAIRLLFVILLFVVMVLIPFSNSLSVLS